MEVTQKGLASRQSLTETRLGQLAYRRLLLSREIEEIDRAVSALEAQMEANGAVNRDMATDRSIAEAKQGTPTLEELLATSQTQPAAPETKEAPKCLSS